MALLNKSRNTIAVDAGSDTKFVEAIGMEEILPGQLLYYDTTDPARRVRRFIASTDGEQMPMLVAVENKAEGKTVEDSYAIGERVYMRHFRPGDLFLARVAVANSFAIGEAMGFTIAGGASRPGEFIDITGDSTSMAHCYEEITTTAAGQLVLVFAN